MRARTASALLAVGLLAGCGPTLFDAKGVPVATPTCTDPALPIACLGAEACVAEDDSHCGTACLDCLAASVNNAVSFCDRSSADPTRHSCATSCNPGFVHDPNGPGCICDVGQTQCAGSTTCVAQDTQHCGPSCIACGDVPNGTGFCNAVAGACDFTCNAGYQRSGNQCVCADGTVACGAGGACVAESAISCGSRCLACPVPANGGTPICTAHACDWTCPASLPVKCGTAAAPDCCVAPACTPEQNQCQTPTGPQCFAANDVNHCGTLCIDCAASPNPDPLPPDALPACLPNGPDFACGFVCPAGFFKTALGCERVGAGPADVAVGGKHTCIITSDNRLVKCWGANDQGQLGDGTPTDRLTPADVVGLPAGARVHAIAAGQAHSCAVLENGQVWCWGANADDQLGGTPVAPGLPVQVIPFSASTSAPVPIAAGASHTCAINAAGGVSCWGANAVGQLGNGAALPGASAPAPVATGITSGASALASGFDHTCALLGAAVKCWGANADGQIGNGVVNPAGENAPRDVVAGIGGPLSALTVAVGESHSCAAAASGGVRCWGLNTSWQLGLTSDALPPSWPTPTPVNDQPAPPGDPRCEATACAGSWFARQSDLLSTGRSHTCAAKATDLNAKCQGGIGVGVDPATTAATGSARDMPQLGGEISRLFSGGEHNCQVMHPAGAPGGPFDLWCWGVNDRGQVGDGQRTALVGVPTRPQPQ